MILSIRSALASIRVPADVIKCSNPQKSSHFMLLSLPLEIRLQIYGYIIQDNPASHSHLAPLSAYQLTPTSAYSLHAIYYDTSQPHVNLTGKSEPEPFPNESSPISNQAYRLRGSGCGHTPSTLLRTCKQIYSEARLLPWHQNEYIFINWFNSGIYAARAFTRALKPWQRESMRWARIEVLKRDLENTWVASMDGGRPGSGEWEDLCGLWSGNQITGKDEPCELWSGDQETGQGGLWGLRLVLKGRLEDGVQAIAFDGMGGTTLELDFKTRGADSGALKAKNGILDVGAAWVVDGLCRMKALRWLEIEIEDEMISRDVKLEFCGELGTKLTSTWQRKVDVVFREKMVEEKKVEAPLRMFISGLYT